MVDDPNSKLSEYLPSGTVIRPTDIKEPAPTERPITRGTVKSLAEAHQLNLEIYRKAKKESVLANSLASEPVRDDRRSPNMPKL